MGFLLFSNSSFQVVVGIAIFTLIIWRLLKFRKDNQEQEENLKKIKKQVKEEQIGKLSHKGVVLTLIIGTVIAIVLGTIFYQYHPIKALEHQNGMNYLTSYTYSLFLPFNENIKYVDSSCLATFISIFQ